MGYSGEEAMYVSQDVLQEAYGATGHTLQFYMSYNTSNYDAAWWSKVQHPTFQPSFGL